MNLDGSFLTNECPQSGRWMDRNGSFPVDEEQVRSHPTLSV